MARNAVALHLVDEALAAQSKRSRRLLLIVPGAPQRLADHLAFKLFGRDPQRLRARRKFHARAASRPYPLPESDCLARTPPAASLHSATAGHCPAKASETHKFPGSAQHLRRELHSLRITGLAAILLQEMIGQQRNLLPHLA